MDDILMKPSVCCGFLILYGSLCLYWQIVYVQWKAFQYRTRRGKNAKAVPEDFPFIHRPCEELLSRTFSVL